MRGAVLVIGVLLTWGAARAEDPPTLMQTLADKGLHEIEHESWNAYGQFTYISSWKPAFPALYTNLNGSINSLCSICGAKFHRHRNSLPGRAALERRRSLRGS